VAKRFDTYDYDDAANLVGSKVALPRDGTRDYPLSQSTTATSKTNNRHARRSQIALDATEYYHGNHWLGSRGFIGQLPPKGLPGQPQMLKDIEAGFVAENVVKEVVGTHVGGILGREPSWSFLKAPATNAKPTIADRDQETGDTLTPWWNRRKALKDLQKALRIALCEGISVRRLFIPRRYASPLTTTDLPSALDAIYFETVHADRGGVFLDPDTQQEIGIFLYEEHDANGDIARNCAELSFLNDAGNTVCRVVRDDDSADDYGPYQLGGHLLIYQLEREPLITEQVQANQRAVNLAHTMMIRNVNMAGARERTITNAQPPLPVTDKSTITSDTVKTGGRFPGAFKTGPSAVNFVMGVPIWDETGRVIVGYTNPTVNLADPVSVESFEKTIDKEKEAIYAQCHQRHVLIVDKADTSGRAREVARKEYERSLKESKIELDACGRWQLEVTLRLGAQISRQVSKYATLRADFNTLIDAGQPDPAFVQQVIELRKPAGPRLQPLLSDETARELCGVEDAAAELAKIQKEALQPPADPTPLPKADPEPLTQPTGAVN
jgi:hypothetical protein